LRILAIDIGTGTQDILLFDSRTTIENCYKMVMPSPTIICAQEIRRATNRKQPVLLTGVTMGGGPVAQAVLAHIADKLPVYATTKAAKTFDDDLEQVARMGVTILDAEDDTKMSDVQVIELRDLDPARLSQAFSAFGVSPHWDALAIAVFDHGEAPPGHSDRKFRFDQLRRMAVEGNGDLRQFGYLRDEVPKHMTRMAAVAESVNPDIPLLIMGSAEATILGAVEDERVRAQSCRVVINVGNEHTLAFHLHGYEIMGLMEHHTHVLSVETLDKHIKDLVQGKINGDLIWEQQGHGAYAFGGHHWDTFVTATGPLRHRIRGSQTTPYLATPHGDMMLAGPLGLVRAWAEKYEPWREEIAKVLD
jgi:uncharacterized protein (DUF1786 family)